MDFKNMKATISSDFVRYKIFFDGQDLSTNDLLEKKKILMGWVTESYIKDFLWQKEGFSLNIASSAFDQKIPPHLEGTTSFGDNIDDEWYIVYLLKKMTEKYKDISVVVEDNDGQFLLIETAMYIPNWMEPTNSDNKVFLRRGRLHIIPLPNNPSQMIILPPNPDLRTSLSILQSPNNKSNREKNNNINNNNIGTNNNNNTNNNNDFETEAKIDVQICLNRKLDSTFESVKNSVHHSNAFLPYSLAILLKQHPQLISQVVECFYYRDYDDMKSIQIMKQWNPTKVNESIGEDRWVLVSVRFSRCLYAQITKQEFYPPKPFLSFLPTSPQDPLFKPTLLGIKIVCGFEMVYQKAARSLDDHQKLSYSPQKMVFDWPFDTDVQWMHHFSSLQKNNFFNNFPEKSKEYQNLLKRAKFDYVSSTDFIERYNKEESQKNFKIFYDDFISKQISHKESFLKEHSNIVRPSDNEDWLNITPEQVDDILFKKQKEIEDFFEKNKNGESDFFTAPSSVKDMLNDIKSFVNTVSSFEGAEFPEGSDPKSTESKKFSSKKFFSALQMSLGLSDDPNQQDANVEDLMGDSEDDLLDEEEENGEIDVEIKKLMQQMDDELLNEKSIADDFEKVPIKQETNPKESTSSEPTPQKVDINLNLVKNILESFEEQNGASGPLTNLLNELKETRERSKDSK